MVQDDLSCGKEEEKDFKSVCERGQFDLHIIVHIEQNNFSSFRPNSDLKIGQ